MVQRKKTPKVRGKYTESKHKGTHQQEMYARYRVYDQLPMIDSYLRAYKADVPDKAKLNEWRLRRDAQKIEDNNTIQSIMAHLRDEMMVYEGLTPARASHMLNQLQQKAEAKGNLGVAFNCLKTKFQMAGLLVDKHHHIHEHQLTTEEAQRQLAHLVQENPELKAHLGDVLPLALPAPAVTVEAEVIEAVPVAPGAYAGEPPPLPEAPLSQQLQPAIEHASQ